MEAMVTEAEYLVGRLVTFAMAFFIFGGCILLMIRKRASWRVLVPVMLWTLSIGGRAIVPVFIDPSQVVLTTWSRLNILYSGALVTLMMALLYTCIGNDSMWRAGNKP